MSPIEGYTIRAAAKQDIPTINSLLEENFHPEETILKCLLSNNRATVSEEHLKQIDEDQRTIIEAMITNFPCQVVIHEESKKIAGVNVMIASENPNLQIENRSVDVYEAHPPKCEILSDYFRYMNDMLDKAELFAKFPQAKMALEFYAVAVDKAHRRRGLSTFLMRQGIEYAEKNGVDVVFGLFTSPFSKRAAEKVGLLNVVDLDLLDYRDSQGSQLFLDSAPHNIASVMAILTKQK